MGSRTLAARERASAVLTTEEQCVKRNGFGQCHTDDGLNEDFARCTGIAADALNGFGADETYANGGGETAERALDAPCDFSDVDHVIYSCDGWLDFRRAHVSTLPTGKD